MKPKNLTGKLGSGNGGVVSRRDRLTSRGWKRASPSGIIAATLIAATIAATGATTPRSMVASSGSQAAGRISLTDIVRAVHAAEPEETIIARIKRNARPFDLTKEERDELKREGVSDTIMKYLVDPTLPYTPVPGVPAPPVTAASYPDDRFASKVPNEAGAYLLQKSDLVPIDLKTLVAATQGRFTSKVTIGVIKGKVLGHLVGASARTRIDSFPITLYLRLAEPTKIEEVALVAFDVKNKERELEFSPEKAKSGKPTLKVGAMRRFDSLAVGPRLYKLSLSTLATGEYFVYLIGSADPEKGIQGKGYDFGIN